MIFIRSVIAQFFKFFYSNFPLMILISLVSLLFLVIINPFEDRGKVDAPPASNRLEVIHSGYIDERSITIVRDKITNCEYILNYNIVSQNISPNCSIK